MFRSWIEIVECVDLTLREIVSVKVGQLLFRFRVSVGELLVEFIA